ncbi:hypothetical protein [Dactylosporangium sp. CA-233914]|uniref:hypothetical protein n=1 Tax=Dactylosporangium sp. CA-233914 TaxID=3239934 RepID=UPI003D8D6B97
MRRLRTVVCSALLGTALAVAFATVFASPASAATNLYWKNGTNVSKSTVWSGANASNIQCYAPSGYYATMCIRFDRRTIYVRSDKANGYFKLGRWTGGGNAYVCQNNHKNSSGDNTWVGCHWTWPKKGCYTMRTGYGQSDWYVTSGPSGVKCY